MFYSKEVAEKQEKEKGFTFVEDSGRGYRRVVPSPKPIDILELNIIKQLVNNGNIIITVGGGGIPVINDNGKIKGVGAVIDKDFASAKLASQMDADILLILTAVDKVYINYNKENQLAIDNMTIKEAKQYIKEDQFAKGSMLPKIEACINFLENNNKATAIITSLESATDALKGKTGTKITF